MRHEADAVDVLLGRIADLEERPPASLRVAVAQTLHLMGAIRTGLPDGPLPRSSTDALLDLIESQLRSALEKGGVQ